MTSSSSADTNLFDSFSVNAGHPQSDFAGGVDVIEEVDGLRHRAGGEESLSVYGPQDRQFSVELELQSEAGEILHRLAGNIL